MSVRHAVVTFTCWIGLTTLVVTPARAALDPYDVPLITCGDATYASLTLNVCGGLATGAPAGLTIQWKKKTDWEVSGWSDDGTLCKLSLSGQPSLQHPDKSRWELGPNECATLKIGDINFDETGVSSPADNCGLDPLECGTEYVFRWFAHAGRGYGRSAWGGNLVCSTLQCTPTQCTYTQGYWKNHGVDGPGGNDDDCQSGNNQDAWPATIRANGLQLGVRAYTANELCIVLKRPAAGCGVLSMAHQLIAAHLNKANGANDCLGAEIWQAAHDAIGNTNLLTVSGCGGGGVPYPNDILTAFNEGTLCGPHCDDLAPQLGIQPSERSPWGKVKVRYR